MFMSNFTRSGRRAKIWQSITNLSCCSIDLMTKQTKSMKTLLVFIMLFAFSTGSVFAQDLGRSTFFNRCLDDAPPGPTEADVANLYLNQCGDIPAEVVKSVLEEGNDCDWRVEYTYDVKCGDFEEQIKIAYTGGDLTAPQLNDGAVLPEGATGLGLCDDSIPMGPSIADIAGLYSDNCSDVIVEKSGTPVSDGCDWSVTYTYTIRDACFNMAPDLVITYSGGDNQAPQLNKGAQIPSGDNGLNLCYDDRPLGPTEGEIAALFSDNCGGVNVIKSTSPVKEVNDCKWMVAYQYSIEDDCGNFAEPITIQYTGGDTEAPELSGDPDDVTVSCIDLIPPAEDITALDNCTELLKVILDENIDNLGNACEGGTVVRTWTVVDNCGYSSSVSQTVTVLPAPTAEFDEVEDMEISCEEANSYQPGYLAYTNGGAGACEISGEVLGELSGSYDECGGTLTVNWTYTDDCDRTIEASKTITVLPAPAAEFDEVEDMEVTCAEALAFQASPLGYSNGGTGACEISGEVDGEVIGDYTTCGGFIYVDYVFTDDCDRTITAKKTITVLPAPMAEFDEVEDMEISCEEANSYQAGALAYSNGEAPGTCNISGEVQGELSGSYDECGGTLTVNWTYTDECDRTIEASKTITVLPAPMAEFDEVEDMEISCEEANSFEPGTLGYTNGGTGACEISGEVQGELSGSYTECGGTLEVDWTYTDDCDRTITAKKTITVLPAPAAEFDEVEDMEISCEEANSYQAGSLGYTNGGTGACEISGEVQGELSGSYDECGGTLYVNWTYTDACERTIEASKTITVLPAPMAEFDEVEDMEVSCEEAASVVAGTLGYTNGGTGACEISGEVQGELSGSYDECGGTLYIDWTYTDNCQRTIDYRKTITVLPAPAAEFDEVEDMEVSCEEAASVVAGSLGYTNGGTGACEISGEVEGELSGSYDECGGTLTVNWTYTDKCERTITASKTITVLPAPMAEFNDVQDISIACELASQYEVNPLGYTNGGTGACEISGEVEGELSGSYDECGGTLYVDWTYTDACGRTIDARKTITVEPAPMAEFDEVEDMEISCEEANSFEAGALGYTNGGTGACEISGEVQGELSGSYDECGGTLYIDWTYTDDCDRTITAKKTITVLPAPMAEFDEVEDMEISCEEANSYQAGSLGYTNGGTGACEISGEVQGELSGSYDECGGTLYVNWTYTDACERTIEASKTITVLPAPMAEFDEVEDMEVSCEEAASVVAGTLGYTNGGTGACEISGEVQGELSGSYDECGGTLYIDWTYTDNCQRTIDYRKTITVLPAPMAEFDEVEDMEISCEEANSFEPGSLGYTNGGTGACEISGEVQGELSGSYDECGGTLSVDWTYTDKCDRTITAKKTITVLPAPMAEFDEVEDMEVSCEEAASVVAGSLGYTNGGTGACEIAGEVLGELSGSYDECGGTLYIDWTYTDNCQRTIEARKTITVLPAPMAEFDEVEDMEISCEEANLFEPGTLGYTNGGTGACEISGEVQGELSGSYTECGGTLEVDWTYTDDCNRTITAKKTITVLPAPMAEFDEVEDMEISCEEANSYQAGSLGYTNGGTGACEISGEVQGEATPDYDECGGVIIVNWTYTDNCQRTIEASKTITVLPAPMAEFDEVEDMEISCEEANSFEAGSLGYTNGGTGACEISGEVQGELSGSYDECGGTLYIDWTYTDDCDRTITAKKTITVLPAPMAEFDEVEDMEVSCEEAASVVAGSLGYTNGGTGACEISGEVQGELSGSYDECGGTLYVDWTYTDNCQRTIDYRKTITVLPAPMAEFEQVDNITITCEEANSFTAYPLGYSNGGTGACEISGEVEGELSGQYSECGGLLFIDWTYTDDCDRTITERQQIKVNPAPAAEFDEVEDMEISCEEANSFEAGSLGYTNGGTGACEISGEVQGELSGSYDECGGTLYVDWTYTDNCQRTIEARKTITVLPAPMAEFDEVEDMEISCEEANLFEPGTLGYTNGGTGACEISGEVQGELSGSYTECGGTLEVDWTYTDDCNRTITAKKTITVLPAPAAEFDEVEDMEISCEEANSYQAGSLGYTNGGTGACEISGEVQGEATPDYDECGGVIIVNWTYTDNCQRTIEASKTITVLPAPMAEFDEVEDMEISCEEANSFEAGSLGYTNGGTGACEISGEVQGELSGSYTECGGTLEVDWTYTDDCNRTITAKKTITVLPAPAAEFDEVEDMEVTCEEAASVVAGTLGYTNGGTGACEISGEVEGELSGSYDECGGTLYVDWTYTDNCQRTIEARKTITVLPAPMAEFDEVEDMEISCEEANSFEAGALGYSNGGTGACEISGEVEGELSGSYDECGGTLYIDWTYTDDCDRTITAKKTITVLPAPMAEFDEVEDMEVSCEEAASVVAGSLGYTNGGTGACEISGEVLGELSGSYDECGGTLYIDWTYTDNCQRTIEARKTITVLPAPMAEFDEVEDMEISCEEANSYQAGSLGYTNGGTGACEISGEVQGELSGSYDECGGTLYVNWTYTDACERTIEASKTITVLPAPMAEFDEVEDMEVSCEEAASVVAGTLGYTNGGTGACEISGEVLGELSGSYDECGGTLYIDWTYTDNCQRTIEARKTITVLPAPMAEFDEVEDMEISCEEANSYQAGSLGYTNGGTGACEISGEVLGELSGSYDECGGTLYIDWTYTDDCDRTITAKKTITVLPAPAAEFDEVEDMEISCEEANSFEAGALGYSNGGTGACEISGEVQGEATPDYDECGGVIIVNWTYTDNCQRTIEASKTITVLPAPAAEFDEVENMEISCEEANSFEAGALGYTNGGTGVCEISGEVQGELSGSYDECGGTLYIDWTYTDDCNRTITAKKEVTVLPAPMAEFNDVQDITIACYLASQYEVNPLGYTNGGTGACEISGEVEGELSGSYDECGGTLYVDWTYTDACNRTIEARKTITVLPAPAAEFDEVEDMEISCEEANSFVAGALGYSNGVDDDICNISGEVPGELSGSYTECGGTLYIDWTYTDACDRTITAKKEVTVLPAPMAEFDEVEDMEVSCEAAASVVAGPLGYTNGGTGACEIAGEVQGELSGSYDECGGTLYIDWTYTDNCQRTIEARKTITVLPAPMAEFDEVEDMEISCEEANLFEPGTLGYTNGGTGACEISGEVQGELSGSYTECGGTLSVDWTYTDDCDRTITAKKTITVLPAPMAEFDEVEDMEVSCEAAASVVAGSLGYTNGGTGACEISGEVQGDLSGSYDECGGTLYVNWTYIDNCQRTIHASKTITVLPAPMAEFDEVEDMEISCEEANLFEPGSLGYTNGGTGACEISGEVQGELSGSYTECGGTLEVDWTYTDDCNRTITAKKTITVLPAPAAEFDEVEDMEVTCEEAASIVAGPLGYTNGGTGACEIAGEVQGELSGSYDECGGTLYIDWTYTDACNRTIEARKTITVLQAPVAEFDDPGEMEISCTDALLNFEATPLGYSNGATGACEISGEVDGTVIGDYTTCGGFIYVDYTFTDDCGRKITAKKIVTVLPAEEAEFDEVEDMEITCEEAETFQAGSLGFSNGGSSTCRIEGSVEGELSGSYTECGGTLTVDWTYTDVCDRTITASKTVSVLPAPMAEFDEVEDMEISCEDVASFEGGSLSYNNGATGACEISGSVQGVPQPFEGSCGSFDVDYTFTDDCGRTITAKKTVTVIDNVAPMPTGVCDNETVTIEGCPATAEISLEIGDEISIEDRDWTIDGISIEELNGTLAPCFTDNCADVSDLTFRVIGKDAERKDCETTLTVTFEVEDTCENVSEPFTCTFIVQDTTGPSFNEELPQDIAIECGEEIPAAPVLTASDDCSDATVDYNPGLFRRECKADDASNHTLWIANNGGLDATNRNWTSTSTSTFEQFSNGTAKLTGTVANVNNANQIFEFVAWFKDASTYEEWTSIPNAASPTGFRQAKLDAGTSNGATLADAQTWTYYLMDESKDNKLVGQGDYAGVELALSHNPSNLRYGLQYGNKASLQSNGLGVSTWIKIQGDYDGGHFSSNGDFNVALSDCVEDPNFDLEGQCDATIVRTWTATDACGNETVHTQTITISDNTPPVVECPEDVDFGYVTETPSGFADKAPYTDNCSASGQTQVFTDSETTVEPGGVTQVGTELRFIFQAGYILTFGDAPAGTVNDAPYYQGFVTDLDGNYLPQYGNFELIFYFNNLFFDYSIVQNGEEVGFGPRIDGLPSCNSEDWYVESVNGHNKALTVECGQFESTLEYSFTRTFYAVDACGNEGECSVEYTWSTAGTAARSSATEEEGFAFYPTNRDPEASSRMAQDLTVDFKAYPVPFDKEVNIAYSFEFDTNVTIELFDTKGLLILSETNDRYVTGSQDKTTFDLSRISNQMFYVKLTTSQGSVTKKIVSSGKK